MLYHPHTDTEALVSSTRETSPPLAPPRFFLVPRSAASFSKPNPKRAERHLHYHSCSRQRKVCLVSVLFRHPTTFDADTVGAHSRTWGGRTPHVSSTSNVIRVSSTLHANLWHGSWFPSRNLHICVCIRV